MKDSQAMTYAMNDCAFTLPDTLERDFTINMLKFEHLEATLVVGRGQLEPDDENLQASFERQLELLKRQVANYRETVHQATLAGANQDIPAFEVQSRFVKGNDVVCQFQLALQIPDTRKLLVFTYSKGKPLTAEDAGVWHAIKQSIRLA